jgi:hypothetical protein
MIVEVMVVVATGGERGRRSSGCHDDGCEDGWWGRQCWR